jgi:hypothetical protein
VEGELGADELPGGPALEAVGHVRRATFAGPKAALRYLARYTHRVAISNARLISLDDDHIVFRYRDRRCEGQWRTMRLHAVEFLRRFLQHVLPYHFVRIRYFGWMANRHRRESLERIRGLLGVAGDGGVGETEEEPSEVPAESRGDRDAAEPADAEAAPPLCPYCRSELRLATVLPRPPPHTSARVPP